MSSLRKSFPFDLLFLGLWKFLFQSGEYGPSSKVFPEFSVEGATDLRFGDVERFNLFFEVFDLGLVV